MTSIFSRTSVTVDEAVAILLGWINGPWVARPLSDEVSQEEQDEIDSQMFVLQEHLDDETDSLESDLAEAKFDKLPKPIIDAKRAALQKHRTVVDLAKSYLCAIDNELNKGDTSILRVDVKLSNAVYTYITMTSLDEWFANKGYPVRVLVPVPTTIPVKAGTPESGVIEEKPCPQGQKPKQRRLDALAAELKDLLPTMQNPTAASVMAELRSRVGKENTAITANLGDCLQWEDNNGIVRTLRIGALGERIRLLKNTG